MEEEENIEEYLNRSDTAVIYPQPVSEPDEEDDTGDSVNNTDDEYLLKCMHCKESFSQESRLHSHIKAMHSEKSVKFMCSKCEETFTLKSQLDNHMELHLATSQTCTVCKKTFANVYRLQRHMISHNESTSLRKFKCEECGKAFKFKHHLKEHIRIHSGEKPFECSNCRKRFSHSGSYSSHMTSKKCWVVNMKSRRIDHNGNAGDSVPYSPASKNGHSQSAISLQKSSGSLPRQLITYDNPNSSLPKFFPNASSYISYPMYPQKENLSDRIAPLTNQTIAHSNSSKVSFNQKPSLTKNTKLSPDMNSNMQPLSMVVLKKPDSPAVPLQSQVTSPPLDEQVIKTEPSDQSEVIKVLSSVNIKKENSKDGFPVTDVMQEKHSDSPPLPPSNFVDAKDVDLTCRFCASAFRSPVALHQHERYLCKSNKDIVHRVTNLEVTSCNSPSSTTSSSEMIKRETPNGSLENGTDEEEAEEIFKEENLDKKFRMRSMISDDQLQVLKKYYQLNPRPRKHDLIKIGNEIGFPKRVVQVWFQNMRARDRKKGKNVPYFPAMARFKQQEDSATTSSTWKEPVKSTNSAYIPVVPHFNNSVQIPSGIPPSSSPSFPAHSHTKVNGQFNAATENRDALFNNQDQPLDLSLKREPPRAHSGHKPVSSNAYNSHPPPATPSQNFDNEVLNLSCRSPISVKQEHVDGASSAQSSFQESALYKYMKQEGMIVNKPALNQDATSLSKLSHSSPIPAAMQDSLTSPYRSSGKSIASGENESKPKVPKSELKQPDDSSMSSDGSIDSVSNRSLVIDESKFHNEKSDGDCLSDDDDEDDDDSDEDDSPPRLSNGLSDGNLTPSKMREDNHQTNPDGTKKPKRLRKKSWKQSLPCIAWQMASEEIQLDLEETNTVDEDHPHRKKRRSWKNHRVDVEEGLYACDQCDKMFSKQSSLARHKYEHSGARPFVCDECPKAFKHKHHLTEHKRLHSGEKPFQCKKCSKRFSHSGSYSQHMNHRYKYCKPPKHDEEEDIGANE
ncbi:zinc finger protein 1-like isoform X1 [Octopus sinensis]|uniref:Zinc finger protein 1-like isoform X1 n=1 Tax=Octopus sinensis TaxID=2607531 RepID=A0A6P7TAG2_9MOLL|nr:zinc finger protein 1-like isoform X1 [Octopus sinensis]